MFSSSFFCNQALHFSYLMDYFKIAMKSLFHSLAFISCFFGVLFVSNESFTQSTPKRLDTVAFLQRAYYVKIGHETATFLSSRSEEEKEWFKKTFIHKKGQFTIPTAPIQDPFEENKTKNRK